MNKNVECSCCDKVEAVEYFELLGMRYSDLNAVTQRILKLPMKSFLKLVNCIPATVLNLGTCTIFRTRYSAPEADLGLRQFMRLSSL